MYSIGSLTSMIMNYHLCVLTFILLQHYDITVQVVSKKIAHCCVKWICNDYAGINVMYNKQEVVNIYD